MPALSTTVPSGVEASTSATTLAIAPRREHGAGRIGGAVDHQHPRARPHQRLDLVHGRQEVAGWRRRVADRDRRVQQREHLVVGPGRVGDEHLVAGLQDGRQHRRATLHRALADDHPVRRAAEVVDALQLGADRLAQLQRAGALGVPGAGHGGAVPGLDHVRRREEVGLTDLQPQNAAAPLDHEVDDLADPRAGDPGGGRRTSPGSWRSPRFRSSGLARPDPASAGPASPPDVSTTMQPLPGRL